MRNNNSLRVILIFTVLSSLFFVSFALWWLADLKNSCPARSPYLVGAIPVEFRLTNQSKIRWRSVKRGGWWEPSCIARKKVALLVPYRNRNMQLQVFLNHIHPILQRQQLHYRIFVVEQVRIIFRSFFVLTLS